ncbi:hypothetical protein [Pedobacter sp. AJM]|uniref:hypothetical protein n=1 Tax=Pedobacter sp. AJM TaxID=2003629 RepID=UPI000B4A7DE9|nr:hypothetical protein [Pedobacter sp. AJM]OWK70380.1 hypothetical protein CBW18_13040 [Pedobacter sp. AJM]
MISQPDIHVPYNSKNQFKSETLSSSGLITMFIKFIIYGIAIVGVAQFLMWQVTREQQGMKFSEASAVEVLQSILLLFSGIILTYGIVIYKNWRPLLLLIAEFLFISLVREQDAYLDLHYFDGAWQTIVILSLPFPIYFAIIRRKKLIDNLKVYTSLFAFGIMISGILTTYIFSRLYGRRIFWMAAMENGYMRDVKNISEESLETYGYLLIFIASIELIFLIKRLDVRSKNAIKVASNADASTFKIVQPGS